MTNTTNPFDALYQQLSEIKEMIATQGIGAQSSKKESLLLTRKEAMEFLNIRDTTIWKLTRDGVLTSYKIGNRVMYKRPELLAALDTMAA